MKFGVIDYGGGNLQSVRNALRQTGADVVTVTSPQDLLSIGALIFPGQGRFDDSMAGLSQRALIDPLREWIHQDRPFLGICIGYQALFGRSEENPGVPGLGVFEGQVVRFSERAGRKIPHMGWNQVKWKDPKAVAWEGQEADPFFYFVHSYYPEPADPAIVAGVTDYEGEFACAIQRGNLLATQFHPEKSQSAGLTLLESFVRRNQVSRAG